MAAARGRRPQLGRDYSHDTWRRAPECLAQCQPADEGHDKQTLNHQTRNKQDSAINLSIKTFIALTKHLNRMVFGEIFKDAVFIAFEEFDLNRSNTQNSMSNVIHCTRIILIKRERYQYFWNWSQERKFCEKKLLRFFNIETPAGVECRASH